MTYLRHLLPISQVTPGIILVLILLAGLPLCKASKNTVYEPDHKINLHAFMVKWFFASSQPPQRQPHKKIVLGTLATDKLGDFSYLMEVYNEIKYRKPVNDDVQIQFRVIASEWQKQLIYKTFLQAREIDVVWQSHMDDIPEETELTNARDVDLTLALAAFPTRHSRPAYPWLEILQFRSVSLNPYYLNFLRTETDTMVSYFNNAVCNPGGTVSLKHSEGGPLLFQGLSQLKGALQEWQESKDVYNIFGAPPHVCSIDRLFFCQHSIQFGLEGSVGLPFNSGLREKVEQFELSSEKQQTSMADDLRKLFRLKPWLAQAVTGFSDPDMQLSAFFNHSYFAAYHHELANLKEFMAIIGELDDEITLVSTLKWDEVKALSFRDILAQLGYFKLDYISEDQIQHLTIPDARGHKKLRVINPGFVQDEDGYNAMLYFSHPVIHVAGNISLVKAITMNKLPFYEWRYFQTHINPALQKLWQGTGYETWFRNEYSPESKAAVLKQTGIDINTIKKVSQTIISEHNAMPDLMDVIRLAYKPEHPLWVLAKKLDALIDNKAYPEAEKLVFSLTDPVSIDVMAARLLLAINSNPGKLRQWFDDAARNQLLSRISDRQIKRMIEDMFMEWN